MQSLWGHLMVQKHNLVLTAFGANLKWRLGMLMISMEEPAYISNREGAIDNSAACS
jgi:hypothetical protein